MFIARNDSTVRGCAAILASLGVFASACGGKGGTGAAPGAVTVASVMKAKDLVRPFESWGDALGKLEATVGKSTFQSGKWFAWAAVEGSRCAYLKVEQRGEQVGIVQEPMTVEPDGPVMNSSRASASRSSRTNYQDCLEAAGKAPAAKVEADDPNVASPPSDGAVVTVAALREGVAKAKARWVGQVVKLSGLFVTATTQTVDEVKTVNLSLSGEKGNITDTVLCELKGVTEAPTVTQWGALTVTGKVTDLFGGTLAECAIVK